MAYEDKAEELEGLLGPFAVAAETVVSGTAYQNPNQYSIVLSVPVSTAGTVEIQVSNDGVTFTTLEAARAVAATGSPNVNVHLKPGQWAKLTATTTVLGAATVY